MTPRHILAFAVLVCGVILSSGILITAAQGRGIDDSTAYVIGAAIGACIAGALGVVLVGGGRKRRKDADTPTGTDAPGEVPEGP